MTKNRPKLNCATFFEKFKNCFFFFWFFLRRCLKNSSEGTKNNQKKISSCFRENCEFMFKKSREKNQPPILAKFFEKSNFFKIFWFFRKKYLETHSKRIRNRFEKIVSSLRDISSKKKKLPDHPIPSIPSVTLKNFENQKRSILEGVFEIKKKVV